MQEYLPVVVAVIALFIALKILKKSLFFFIILLAAATLLGYIQFS